MRRISMSMPSPAMVVAVAALVFATSGVASAAVVLLPNPLPLQKQRVTVTHSRTVTATGGAFASAEVQCAVGERLLSGATRSSQDSSHFVWADGPITAGGQYALDGQSATGWAGSVSVPAGVGGGTVTVTAVCERATG